MMNASSSNTVAVTAEENRPKVSIILPVYNGAQYLAKAIESCQAQTFVNWELIIVDDASTDETPQIIADFCAHDGRIRSIRHAVNRKLPTALNTGFSEACGDLLTWTSDDNLYRPEALTAMVEFLGANPDIDVVYSDYSVIDAAGTCVKQVVAFDPVYLMRENVVGPSFMYRRRVHEGIGGYDPELFLVEDYDFWLRAAAHFRIVPLHRDLYLYRRHQASLSNTQYPRILHNREITLGRNLPHLTWLPRKAVVAGWFYVAILARRRGDYLACLRGLWCAAGKSLLHSLFLGSRIIVYGTALIRQLNFQNDIESINCPPKGQK